MNHSTLFDVSKYNSPSQQRIGDWEQDVNNGLETIREPKTLKLLPKSLALIAQSWNADQLEKAIAILQGLLDIAKPPAHQQPQGYIEEKMINGCGPYQYLRYKEKGKRKSIYLGKTQPIQR